ncbi:hypothetical protein WJX74_005403 [Apatococcus lobatus]|uniref:Transcriptional regulator n=2 Tax=Apatococcus TaxID=904362 RepID=A0AAW1T7S9_9CHLO
MTGTAALLLADVSQLAATAPRLALQRRSKNCLTQLRKSRAKQDLTSVCQAAGSGSEDTGSESSSQDPVDWRSFRAQLVALEQQQLQSISAQPLIKAQQAGDKPHWVHQIACPEAGSLLIARHPDIGVFTRTVILILQHGNQPTSAVTGLILNLPTKLEVQKLVAEEGIRAPPGHRLRMGGPCRPAGLFALHSSKGLARSLPILDGVYQCDDMQVLAAAMNEGALPPQQVRFFLGYAGWTVEQLTWEVEVGTWWIAAASSSLIRECLQGVGWQEDASNESDGMWHRLCRLLDVQSHNSPAPGMGDFLP